MRPNMAALQFPRMHVLVVEDEPRMADLLRRGLQEEGCSVVVARDGVEALEVARDCDLDAIILDVMLPRLDGFDVLKRLRHGRDHTPVLLLTARDAARDVVSGLDLGADDYLTKPFSFEVLLARLRAIARRGRAPRAPLLRVADLTLDPATREVIRGGQSVQLTRTEFMLLEFLMRRAGRVVPRYALIEALWGLDSDIESNTLDAFIRLLRSKVDAASRRKLIHTIRGVGYCLREEGP